MNVNPATRAAWQAANRAEKQAQGLCVDGACQRKAEPGRLRCLDCLSIQAGAYRRRSPKRVGPSPKAARRELIARLARGRE